MSNTVSVETFKDSRAAAVMLHVSISVNYVHRLINIFKDHELPKIKVGNMDSVGVYSIDILGLRPESNIVLMAQPDIIEFLKHTEETYNQTPPMIREKIRLVSETSIPRHDKTIYACLESINPAALRPSTLVPVLQFDIEREYNDFIEALPKFKINF